MLSIIKEEKKGKINLTVQDDDFGFSKYFDLSEDECDEITKLYKKEGMRFGLCEKVSKLLWERREKEENKTPTFTKLAKTMLDVVHEEEEETFDLEKRDDIVCYMQERHKEHDGIYKNNDIYWKKHWKALESCLEEFL